MTAPLDAVIIVGCVALALLFCAAGWILFGRPEPRCPGCDLPESKCECQALRLRQEEEV